MPSVCIAVIDSGFQQVEAFNSIAPLWVDFTGGVREPPVLSGPVARDAGSHGTRAAVTIASLAGGEATFLLCRVAATGSTMDVDRDVANAIRFAAGRGAQVIYFGWASYEPLPAVDDAMAAASDTVLFVAPAGNSTGNIDENPVFPAALAHENLLVVTHERLSTIGCRRDDVGHGRRSVDAVVTGLQAWSQQLGSELELGDTSGAAAAAAGLAARTQRHNPTCGPAALKRLLLQSGELPADGELMASLRSWTSSGRILPLPG